MGSGSGTSLPCREQMEFSPPNPLEMAQNPPKSEPPGQSHQSVLVTKSTDPGVARGWSSVAKDVGRSWEQHGITGCLGNVDLMGLGCGFMYGLGFWLLVRNPNQRSLFPESHTPEAELQLMFSSGITLLTQSRHKTKGLGEKILPSFCILNYSQTVHVELSFLLPALLS